MRERRLKQQEMYAQGLVDNLRLRDKLTGYCVMR